MRKRNLAAILNLLLVLLLIIPFSSLAALVEAAVPGGTLDPATVTKYVMPLFIPPAMPATSELADPAGPIDYYEIAAQQFQQQVLPDGMPATTVWGYGAVGDPGSLSYPAYTIEATYGKPVRVQWVNGLVDANGDYLPPLLPVDQTLHWANPPGGVTGRDAHGADPAPYAGPVPIVTHLHGANVEQDSDGYPDAWYLPAAGNIPAGYAAEGSMYAQYESEAEAAYGQAWEPGAAVYQYPNDQRATTLWYHDHALGMTRTSVYAGLSGFYIVRGGPDDLAAGLPSGAYEVPLLIQDKSFNADGSLFYPDNRAFFEGLDPGQLQIPFMPDSSALGMSDVAPIWNPEFFGNTMLVNGRTWPYLEVEQRQYRFRMLNGSDSRFLILRLSNGAPLWVIGADGGFLPAPVQLSEVIIAPAERLDILVDFSGAAPGTEIILENTGPDEPYGGGVPDVDFPAADPATTGQVMQFRVVAATGADASTPAAQLALPAFTGLGAADNTRQVSLNELDSATVNVPVDGEGNWVYDVNGNLVEDPAGAPFGPAAARLGTLNPDGSGNPLEFEAPLTENPALGSTEVWEIYNFTADAHPIHIHLVQFQVIEREDIATGAISAPEAWESGYKDTLIAYPDQITRFKAKFDREGQYVWHCHILSHEDNEMMRPFSVGVPGAPTGLVSMVVSATQADLSWTDNSLSETGFAIQRSADNISFVELAVVAAGISAYSDDSVQLGGAYWYRVVARNDHGDSAPASTGPVSVAAPSAPAGLTATIAGSSQVDLSWGDTAANETSLRVDRAADAGFTLALVQNEAPRNTVSYSDATVVPGGVYYYRVVALNAVGDSAPAVTGPVAIPAPARLYAGAIDPATIYEGRPNTGWPGYYEDDQGTRVSLLPLSGDGVNAPTQIYDAVDSANPYSVFLGFGTEAFYYLASTVFNTGAGIGLVEFAIEAAFGAGPAEPGQEMVFTRTRVRVDVPAPGSYTLEHPYGSETFTVTAADIASGKAINMTRDIGAPRDFAAATAVPLTRFLRPTAAPPAGWLGDGASVGPVTGSPLGFNLARLTGPEGVNLDGAGNNFVQTDQWTVSGRLLSASVPASSFTSSVDTGAAPLTVDFSDTTTGAVTARLWDFGDGATSALQNPSKTYDAAGDYVVRLTTSSAAGRSTSARIVHVYGAPVAGFTSTAPNGLPPVAIDFSDVSSGNISAWSWDFGDGTTSTLQNPSKVYAAGAYTISLTVANPAGRSSISRTLAISDNLVAGFDRSPFIGIAPLAADFTDASIGAVTAWSWDFGDGATSTLQNPSKTYDAAGNYVVTLTVSDAAGSSSVSRPVWVYTTLAAGFTMSAVRGITPLNVSFGDTSAGNPASWAWDFGDGSGSSLQNPSHVYAAPGAYTVTLTVMSPAGRASTSQKVIVTNIDPAVPLGLEVGPIDAASIYQGNPNTGWPAYYEDDQGTRVALLPLAGDGLNAPTQVYDAVDPANPYSVFLGFGSEAFYYMATAVFDTSAGRGLVEFAIEAAFGAGPATPGQEMVFTRTRVRADVPAPGIYTLQHPYGSETFTVTAADIASGKAINMTRDIGAPRDFAVAAAGAVTRFLRQASPPTGWLGDGGTTGPVTGSPTGFNQVRLTGPVGVNLDGAGHNFVETNQFSVSGRLVTSLKPDFTTAVDPASGVAPATITFSDATTGAVPATWSWDFGDGTSSNLPNPVKTYDAAGNYTVTLTVADSLGSASVSRIVSIYALPVAAFSMAPLTGGAPVTVNFADASTGNVTGWYWDLGDGTWSTAPNPTRIYPVTGSYTVSLIAMNPAGSATVSQALTVTAAPTAPTGLLANAVSSIQVDLAWVDASDNETGFRIERSTAGTPFVDLITLPAGSTGYSDTRTAMNTSYSYRVFAFNALGDSVPSNVAAVTTPDSIPAAPQGLAVTAALANEVSLAWRDSSVNETSFVVERSTDGTNYVQVARISSATVASSGTLITFTDTGVAPATTYTYRVRAGNAVGDSAPFSTVSVTTSNVALTGVTTPAGLVIDITGTVQTTTRIVDLGSGTTLTIPAGTRIQTGANTPITSLSATPMATPPAAPPADTVMLAVDFGPDGARFNPPISISMGYNPATIPPGSRPDKLRVAYWDGAKWIKLGTTVNTTTFTITARVDHFSTFGMIAEQAPLAPTVIEADAVSYDGVTLQWPDDASLEDGFRIERSSDGINFATVATLPSGSLSFSDSTMVDGTLYLYRVVAFNVNGDSFAAAAVVVDVPEMPTTEVSLSGLSGFDVFKLDLSGNARKTIRLRSEDGKAFLDILSGTSCLDDGAPVASFSMAAPASVPPAPQQHAVISARELGPEGATFDPAVTLNLTYNEIDLPAGTAEEDLVIAYWDGAAWVILESTVDTAANNVTASVSHFSTYALLAELPAPPTVSISAPAAGAGLPAGDVSVSVALTGFNLVAPGGPNAAGEGHIHYYLDVDIPTAPGAAAVTAPGTYKAGAGSTVTWEGVLPGAHTFGVQLVNNDHTPLDPPVTATVIVTVNPVVVQASGANVGLIAGIIIAAIVAIAALAVLLLRRRGTVSQ